ncbi:hypothetical protein ACVNIS_11525 [Sphaerotilaceae bacterium SBD11-9]
MAQLVRLRPSGKKDAYDLVAHDDPGQQGDIETDLMDADPLLRLLHRADLPEPARRAIAKRLRELHADRQEAHQHALGEKDNEILRLNTQIQGLKNRIDTAKGYLEEDGEALSNGAKLRELGVPVITGTVSLMNGPVNALLNTATGVGVTLGTAGALTTLQVANDLALLWSAKSLPRRFFIGTAMVCQAMAQMLMSAPGTDAALFQAPPGNETLSNNTTAPVSIPGTGNYTANKWIFLGLAIALGLFVVLFRFLDSLWSDKERRRESKRRVREVAPEEEKNTII